MSIARDGVTAFGRFCKSEGYPGDQRPTAAFSAGACSRRHRS
jgi:hypothetical protein